VNVRPLGEGELDALLEVVAADEEQVFGRPSRRTIGDVREWTSRVDFARDSWLFEDGDGPAAVGWVDTVDDLGVGAGIVHPRAKGRGLGAQLVERSEAALAGRVRRVQQFTLGLDAAARELMVSRGYRDVRHFYGMAIELDAPPEVPAVSVEPFREEDARAFRAAIDDAFRDHWEHHPRPFEDWWPRVIANPAYDPSLWFVVRDGDEIAAVIRNEANRNGGGYVGILGVRRPWRGRGYGRALLLHTFREFWQRGTRRVTLGVDAENPTGATKLYESVGMTVEEEDVVYEKALA
jgi:mycothiol synthase